MSLKNARMRSLADKIDDIDIVLPASEREIIEEKIKSSKKPSPKKLKA